MRLFILPLVLFLLTACTASQEYAGVSHYHIRPVVSEGTTVCCEVEVKSGREIGHVHAYIHRTPDTLTVEFNAGDVRGFEGQAIAAEVNKATISAVQSVIPDLTSAIVRGVLGTAALQGAGALIEGKQMQRALESGLLPPPPPAQ